MLNFIVVKDEEVFNLILAESKDIAEQLTGTTCIQYDNTLVNPKIGQSVVDGEVVDLEIYEVFEVFDESELDDVTDESSEGGES